MKRVILSALMLATLVPTAYAAAPPASTQKMPPEMKSLMSRSCTQQCTAKFASSGMKVTGCAEYCQCYSNKVSEVFTMQDMEGIGKKAMAAGKTGATKSVMSDAKTRQKIETAAMGCIKYINHK